MDHKPKFFWEKSFTGRTAWLIWLAVTMFTIMLGGFIAALCNYNRPFSDWLIDSGILAGALLVAILISIYAVWPLFRLLILKHWRRTLFGLACFATLIALFYAEEDWRGWHTWNQFKHQWEAKGEKFTFASVVPPPVPDDQNFAMTPIGFTSYGNILNRAGHKIPYNTNFDRRMDISIVHDYETAPAGGSGNWEEGKFANLAAWQGYYRNLAAKTNEFPVPAKPGSPAADVLLALSQYAPVIDELRQASRLPDSRFPLNYDIACPAEILLPHLSALKNCDRVLQLRSLAELQNSQPQQALDDVRLALQLSGKVRTEPFLISHLVRIAMVQAALQPVWEGLAEHRWSDAQLAELDSQLAKLDFLADYQLAMRGELGCQCGIFDYLRHQPREFLNMVGEMQPSRDNLSPLTALVPAGWYDQNQFRCARMMVEYYVPVANLDQRTISPTAIRKADKVLHDETRALTPFNLFERLLMPALSNCAQKFAHGQSSVDLARVAIALERYRLAHGEFPETLGALGPQFIARLPHDVIGGQPLHYWRTDDGQFMLYSVGWNEEDDGGTVVYAPKSKPPRVDSKQGDWVWRYPAK